MSCSDVTDIPSPAEQKDRASTGRPLPANESSYQPQLSETFSAATASDQEIPRHSLKPGIYVPTLAFFNKESEALDVDTIAKHAVRMAEAGVAGILTQGTNGEAAHLSRTERKVVTKTTRDALNDAGYTDLPIVVGCGAQSTRESIEICYEAQSSGGDFAIILPPSYYKEQYRREELRQFFTDIADASPIPILLYNYPAVAAGIDLDSDMIVDLAQHPNIVGCKLTCGNTGKLNRIAAGTRAATPHDPASGFLCLGGSADFTLQALIGGRVRSHLRPGQRHAQGLRPTVRPLPDRGDGGGEEAAGGCRSGRLDRDPERHHGDQESAAAFPWLRRIRAQAAATADAAGDGVE
ncbi:Dihydrodipicolinate synthetase [Rasamsonia emersonii CBS 393.64]|uniref:Dihydrodipicolinate synthetase n=1 Tax=Rasamsonia emersonii (strain ATCC 16479 / CBS 393.64 / IMI 116815) TaxID=1408163 RepID=A0A0F4YFH4_RASE3|nr:Dihydrodipicolinate synthetase [Rasamsonia emersonii CBS 393.64]KKA17002.1 Dihydrodipicolinate synthetase [Rasamsonia emersonii CBS 393.64]